MKMEIEIVSEGCVVPSSPTLPNLKTYNISFLDQFASVVYFPITLFYPNYQNTNLTEDCIMKRSLLLKQSLSETLSRFYPFAGKVKDELSVDCNDEGIYYVEAKANISLYQYLKQPDLTLLHKLLPNMPAFHFPTSGSYVALIQETTFSCGGWAIGVLMAHMICDGAAFSSFLKGWAATASKSSNEIIYPNVDDPSIFPQNDAFPREASMSGLYAPFGKKTKLCTKRFVFDTSAIASLKDVVANLGVENPTRVEVVSALLSKCLMGIFKARSGVDKPLAITHAVNIRKRAVPPLPECSVGNCVALTPAICKPKGGAESESELMTRLVRQMREAIRKINGDFVKQLQGDEGFLKITEIMKEIIGFPGGLDIVLASGWCNFGFYDIDFGWGKPVWIASAGSSSNSETLFINTSIFLDTKDGGIEAWVYLDENDMLQLEKDKELLEYATVDPSPLNFAKH